MSITAKAISLDSRKFWLSAFLFIIAAYAAHAKTGEPVHALALHGEPKYTAQFTHFDYVEPNAPKGGDLRLGVIGTFDSMNPYIIRGISGAGTSFVYETLMEKSLDEPLTSYGLLAETIEVPENRAWVTFNLRPQAKWHDGKPVTADDVVWSFRTLLEHGSPFFRSYYAQIADVTAESERRVKFTFKKPENRELPLIVGDLPILPKHFWTAQGRDFSKTTLEAPLGSGPYRITKIEAGRQIVLERIKNWWGADMPLHRGRYNFDTIIFDYYRDPGVAFQAFLGGDIDFRQENIAKNWAQGYEHPAVKSGKVIRDTVDHDLPAGMQAFVYNTRRPIFSDPLVREALSYAFDFEWSNKQLAFGSYVRSNSYFANSELAARNPLSDAERALLEPYRDTLDPRVFTEIYNPPKTNGSGDVRINLRKARQLLAKAGWTLDKGVLKNAKGDIFKFEIITDSPMFDRWILPFLGNLKKLGITANLREIDAAQYQNRLTDFDFDMSISVFPQTLTPGNEQHAFWGSDMADEPGSQNLMGIKNPAVDAMINHILHAKTRDDLVTATRALDRVLIWGFYVIPQWYSGNFRIAHWSHLGRPPKNPPFGLPVTDVWWSKSPRSDATGKKQADSD